MVVGVVLAGGAGQRLGRGHPKALVTDSGGRTWLDLSVAALRGGGVHPVYVVVGAERGAVEAVVPPECLIVHSPNWQVGMSASLEAGLAAVEQSTPDADALVVMLVDTPGVGADVVRRLVTESGTDALARAAYDGVPGHPVVIGRAHWAGVRVAASGDRGARDYLRAARVTTIECGDIGTGDDIDTPEALGRWQVADRGPQLG